MDFFTHVIKKWWWGVNECRRQNLLIHVRWNTIFWCIMSRCIDNECCSILAIMLLACYYYHRLEDVGVLVIHLMTGELTAVRYPTDLVRALQEDGDDPMTWSWDLTMEWLQAIRSRNPDVANVWDVLIRNNHSSYHFSPPTYISALHREEQGPITKE